MKSNTPKLTESTVVRFNASMHGMESGHTVVYGHAGSDLQMLIRRRFTDNDNSVEIVKPEKAQTKPTTTEKPTDGKVASKKQKGR